MEFHTCTRYDISILGSEGDRVQILPRTFATFEAAERWIAGLPGNHRSVTILSEMNKVSGEHVLRTLRVREVECYAGGDPFPGGEVRVLEPEESS